MKRFKRLVKRILNIKPEFIDSLMSKNDGLLKFDLGGIGKGENGWKTVNLAPGADIYSDILEIDKYCEDNSVDIFLMSHTYEHLPIVQLEDFIKKLHQKLKSNGRLIIVHTDIKKVLEIYHQRRIDFYALRDIIFSAIHRRKEIFDTTARDLMHHQFMWGKEELKRELQYYGFSKVKTFDAGYWKFDVKSDFPFQTNERYFGVKIYNLGVEAYK